MSKPKMTPWFPPNVKPVHVGDYHVSHDGNPPPILSEIRSHWDGRCWSLSWDIPDVRFYAIRFARSHQAILLARTRG